FNSRPLRPQIQTGRRFDGLGDVCTSDPRSCLQEIKLSVVAALYKLGVCHAANQTKCFDHFTVDRIESSRVRRIPRDLPGSKNATKRYVIGGCPYLWWTANSTSR